MGLNKYTENIQNWAIQRELDEAEPSKQMLKLWEEFGELCGGIAKAKDDIITDSIGDLYVVLAILDLQYLGTQLSTLTIKQLEHNYKSIRNNDNYTTDDYIKMFTESVVKLNENTGFTFIDGIMLELVTLLYCIAKSLDKDFIYCIQQAYDEIKERKGQLINGVFVKASDLA